MTSRRFHSAGRSTSVANPLIAEDFGTTSWEKGLTSAAAIVGAIFGAAVLGPLGDELSGLKARPTPP